MKKFYYNKVLKEALDKINIKDNNNRFTTKFYYVNKKTGKIEQDYNTSCHASFGYLEYSPKNYHIIDIIQCVDGDKKRFIDIIQCVDGDKKRLDKNISKAYIDFLVNRSFYKEAFLSKNVDRIWKTKAFIYNMEVNSNYIASAACATRALSEYKARCSKTWYKLVTDVGIDENIALIMCTSIRWYEKAKKFSYEPMTEHTHLNGEKGVLYYKHVLEFLNSDMILNCQYNGVRGYSCINNFSLTYLNIYEQRKLLNNSLFYEDFNKYLVDEEKVDNDYKNVFNLKRRYIKNLFDNNGEKELNLSTKNLKSFEQAVKKQVKIDWKW